jgi:hypothetical protein
LSICVGARNWFANRCRICRHANSLSASVGVTRQRASQTSPSLSPCMSMLRYSTICCQKVCYGTRTISTGTSVGCPVRYVRCSLFMYHRIVEFSDSSYSRSRPSGRATFEHRSAQCTMNNKVQCGEVRCGEETPQPRPEIDLDVEPPDPDPRGSLMATPLFASASTDPDPPDLS